MIIKILKSLFVYLINISFNNRLIESLLKKMLAALIFMIEYSSELSRVKRLYEIFENSNRERNLKIPGKFSIIIFLILFINKKQNYSIRELQNFKSFIFNQVLIIC